MIEVTKADVSRRRFMAGAGAGLGMLAAASTSARRSPDGGDVLVNLDPISTRLVMNLIVTCSSPERLGPSDQSKDGIRDEIWPIVGGYFYGPDVGGEVVPGGGDYPLVRPDGMVIIDALYRLRTDDGVTILIHNKGFYYPGSSRDAMGTARLVPVFTAPVGKYDWLNKSIFLSTLVEVPEPLAVAKGPDENDRLIQVHRVS